MPRYGGESVPSITDIYSGSSGGGSGALAKMGAYAVNPVLGLGMDVLSTIGSIYNTVIARREAREADKKAEQRYNAAVAEDGRRWEAQNELYQNQYKLSKAQALQRMGEDRKNRQERNEQNNYVKTQNFQNRWLTMLNDPNGQQNFLAVMKGGRHAGSR